MRGHNWAVLSSAQQCPAIPREEKQKKNRRRTEQRNYVLFFERKVPKERCNPLLPLRAGERRKMNRHPTLIDRSLYEALSELEDLTARQHAKAAQLERAASELAEQLGEIRNGLSEMIAEIYDDVI